MKETSEQLGWTNAILTIIAAYLLILIFDAGCINSKMKKQQKTLESIEQLLKAK